MWKFVGLAFTILISIEHSSAPHPPKTKIVIKSVWILFKTFDQETPGLQSGTCALTFLTDLHNLGTNITIESERDIDTSNEPNFEQITAVANNIYYNNQLYHTLVGMLQLHANENPQGATARLVFCAYYNYRNTLLNTRIAPSNIPLLGALENMFVLGYANGYFEPTRIVFFEVENLFDKLDRVARTLNFDALPKTRTAVRFATCVYNFNAGTVYDLPVYDANANALIPYCADQTYEQLYDNNGIFFSASETFNTQNLPRKIFDAFMVLSARCSLVGVQSPPLGGYMNQVYEEYTQLLQIPQNYNAVYNTLEHY